MPMVLFQIDRVLFTQTLTKVGKSQKMEGHAETACRMQYFNAPVGFWEPVIERIFITVKLLGNGLA